MIYLAKFKICPECGEQNPPKLLECQKCEADLTFVCMTDVAEEEIQSAAEVSASGAVRICECGHKNPVSMRKCGACGEDITDIAPIKEAEKQGLSPVLEAVGDNFRFELSSGEHTVGRECEMSDYLSSKTFVSRIHARFSVSAETVSIENLSRTNFTYINNTKLQSGEPLTLKDGDEIALGGNSVSGQRQSEAAYFIMRFI